MHKYTNTAFAMGWIDVKIIFIFLSSYNFDHIFGKWNGIINIKDTTMWLLGKLNQIWWV